MVTGLGAILAICWEVGEWYTFIRLGTELEGAYEDTLGDELLGLVGGFVAALFVAWRSRTALGAELQQSRLKRILDEPSGRRLARRLLKAGGSRAPTSGLIPWHREFAAARRVASDHAAIRGVWSPGPQRGHARACLATRPAPT